MKNVPFKLSALTLLIGGALSTPVSAQSFTEALTSGSFTGNLRMRYESVDQDNAVADADSLTLRSMLRYTTGSMNGFSAVLEAEDVRIVAGQDEFTVGPTGFNPGLYSVIADPESTELNQGFIQYVNEGLTMKLGRQIITHDSHRHIGSVPWRQDWQVYDAFSATYKFSDNFDASYSYLDQRERIFAEEADLDTSDHLFRAAYKTDIGTLVGYAYLLELDDTPVSNGLDTYGIRFSGSTELGEMPFTYLAEYASQESESGATDFDADYMLLEGGLTVSAITAKLGYEVLGSDNGAYGFATPLATLHAFNGWADMWLGTPGTGLEDLYLNVSGKIGGGTLTAVFHDYEADDDLPGISDLGSEFNLQYVKPFGGNYTLGLKYADFDDGDMPGKPDTQKFWIWLQASF